MQKLAFSVGEVATLVSLHPETIRRAIASGELKAANSGGKTHYRISRQDINEWWQSRGGGVLFPDKMPAAGALDRVAAVNAAYGSMKRGGDGRRVERFLAEKHAEAEREIASSGSSKT